MTDVSLKCDDKISVIMLLFICVYMLHFWLFISFSCLSLDDFKFSPVIVEELKKDKVANC